jgi:hypothetical protein
MEALRVPTQDLLLPTDSGPLWSLIVQISPVRRCAR